MMAATKSGASRPAIKSPSSPKLAPERQPRGKSKLGTTKANTAKSEIATPEFAGRIIQVLKQHYPDPQCALKHDNPLQLLVATILSAQCTDVRVNMVTPALFARFPDAPALANAPLPELEKLIQSTGFFRNKAKNIKAACQTIVAEHGGELPLELDALVKLPGVGRKTANVVLGSGFGIPSGVVVDTHVGRLSLRLGLTKQTDAVKVEHELNALVPQDHWIDFSHELILHGRAICDARKPKCEACALLKQCPQIGVTKTAGGDDPQKIPAKTRLARMLYDSDHLSKPIAARSSKSVAPRTRKVSA